MERKMFDTPVLPRLETILAEVKSGDIVVPEFQREFVWDDDRRLKLLDSIAAGMPIGSLLVWRTTNRDLKVYQEIGGIELGGARKSGEKVSYLIDGHQRVSTLFGALHIGERSSDESGGIRWPIYFELGSKERPAFRVQPSRGNVPLQWLPLHIIFDGEKLFEFTTRLRKKGKMTEAKEAERLANLFRDYIIPVVPLVTEDLGVVTDAFVRINSQGKGMSEAHMLRALAYLTIDMDAAFDDVREKLAPYGWGSVDSQVLVNVLKAQLDLDIYSSHVEKVFSELKRDRGPLNRLGDAMVEAAELLENIGVRGPGALPYTYQLVTLATIAAWNPGVLRDNENWKTLWHWFWVTTYTEIFAGTTGSRIREIIRALSAVLKARESFYWQDLGPVKRLNQIRLTTGRTRAFLLFSTTLPREKKKQSHLQEVLGAADTRTVHPLVPREDGTSPGNRVIASATELRLLRNAIKKGAINEEMADAFCIPSAALKHLRKGDVSRFIEERGAWLLKNERVFIEEMLGLTMSEAE
ncbi:DUF262 domain-containing protein [Polyangium sorediatum]|uniref:DUF262 domain-containing protein n=1 Tax=Polyangium sorediatum TaxID=889274 RepID=A0ABT6NZX1_9BACT|nr:DUF262 domain-containing protein [Polyangium sorediatum]MDI1433848.1 DUF262 domain-containing protein [Polyangium sorediatum]